MSNDKIIKILKTHFVPFYEKDGKIYADTMAAYSEKFAEVADLTGMSRREVYEFLGY